MGVGAGDGDGWASVAAVLDGEGGIAEWTLAGVGLYDFEEVVFCAFLEFADEFVNVGDFVEEFGAGVASHLVGTWVFVEYAADAGVCLGGECHEVFDDFGTLLTGVDVVDDVAESVEDDELGTEVADLLLDFFETFLL